jgi:hypothetical protein
MGIRLKDGHRKWSLQRDENGYRVYSLQMRAITDDARLGPYSVLTYCPGLPLPGDMWAVDLDFDPWAWATGKASVKPVVDDKPNTQWDLDFEFSNKPGKLCNDTEIGDPLLQPPKVSGSFVKYTEEAARDRFGRPVVTSSWELLRGQQNEWPLSDPTVKIQMNVATSPVSMIAAAIDHLNQYAMWGLPPRTIRLDTAPWSWEFWGTCFKYYSMELDFAIRARGWDRDNLDEGTKALRGRHADDTGDWTLINIGGQPPDPNNPSHFDRYKDRAGENTRVILDGRGQPFDPRLNEVTSGCAQCPGGAPSVWRVGGLTAEVDLEHQSGCTWAASDDDYDYDLEFISIAGPPAVTYWQFRIVGEAVYSASAETWACLGPNALVKDTSGGPSPAWPDFVVLMGGASPGNVHVERYDEFDFWLFGLPVIL